MATKSLKVKKGHIGVFKFAVYLNGTGKNPKEAWESALEGIYSGAMEAMPDKSDIQLIDQEPWED
jgi:hypothetical protein